jgi:hypothetical protein
LSGLDGGEGIHWCVGGSSSKGCFELGNSRRNRAAFYTLVPSSMATPSPMSRTIALQ